MNSNCEELRNNIQVEFDLKNFSRTIELYKAYENCLNDKQEFLTKLALLYKENNQEELCNEQLNRVINIIENDIELSSNEKALAKASLYVFMDDRQRAKKEIREINKKKLTNTQTEEMESLEFFANQGEFMGTSFKVDFKLFE